MTSAPNQMLAEPLRPRCVGEQRGCIGYRLLGRLNQRTAVGKTATDISESVRLNIHLHKTLEAYYSGKILRFHPEQYKCGEHS
jgi:hypothetical protein